MPTIANEASRDRLWLNWAWSIESAEVGTSRIYGNSEGLAVHHPPQNIHTGTENVDRWCLVGSTCFPFQCLFRRGSMHFLICLRIHIVTVCLAEDRDHYYYGADELFRQGVCGWNADAMVFMFTVLLEEKLLKLKRTLLSRQTHYLSHVYAAVITHSVQLYACICVSTCMCHYVSLNMRPWLYMNHTI